MNNKETQTEELENLRNNCLTYLCTHFFCLAFLLFAVLGEKRIDTLSGILIGGSVILTWYIFLQNFQKYLSLKKLFI